MPLTVEAIASATRCPFDNVARLWPSVCSALDGEDIRSDMVEIAAAATIAVETGIFLPVRERRASEKQVEIRRLQDRYWSTGYYGRGLIQLTWARNYHRYGQRLGLPLLEQPDLLLEPGPSAAVLAAFFADNQVAKAANQRNWRLTRRLVNGGFHGWEPYERIVAELLRWRDA